MAIDIVFVIFAAYGFYMGFSKGIIKTIFTILSYVIGLMAAFKFSPVVTNFLETTFKTDNPLMYVAGFLLSFVLTMVLIRMLAKGLEGVLQTANINIINQAAGGVVLAAAMVLVYSVILWFGETSHIVNEESKSTSLTYPYLKDFPDQIWEMGEYVRPVFEEFLDHSAEFMDKIQESVDDSSETSTKTNIYDIEDDGR